MNKFQYKLMQFMIGRRGFDQFSRDLMVFSLVLIAADILVPGELLGTFGMLVMVYSYYRALSRNLTRRHAENEWYVTYVGSRLRILKQRDYKHYRYFRCPQCRQTLRAPKGRGKIRVTCSRCHSVFEKKV